MAGSLRGSRAGDGRGCRAAQLPSSRGGEGASPPGASGDDSESAWAYCERFELEQNDCYAAEVPVEGRVNLRPVVKDVDDAVDDLFQLLRGNPTADRLFYLASETADYSVLWHLLSAGLAVANPNRRADAVRMATMLGAESIVVNGILKGIVDRERPEPLPDHAEGVRRPKTKSFPSGHASSATLAAMLLGDAYPSLRPAWVSLAAIVSASRVHNRMHHASDVAAGVAIGALFGLVAKRAWPLR